MSISLSKIQEAAGQFMFYLVVDKMKSKTGRFAVNEMSLLESPEILQSDYSREFVNGIVLGAINEYHSQLREKLLKKGIDIGEMIP